MVNSNDVDSSLVYILCGELGSTILLVTHPVNASPPKIGPHEMVMGSFSTFYAIISLVRFSFCKKPLKGENVLYNLGVSGVCQTILKQYRHRL